MGCSKDICILRRRKLCSRIGGLVGVVCSVNLRIGDLKVLNACGLILGAYCNLYISLIEAEGHSIQDLVHDRSTVFDGHITGIGLVNYKLSCILGCCILCKVGVVQLH